MCVGNGIFLHRLLFDGRSMSLLFSLCLTGLTKTAWSAEIVKDALRGRMTAQLTDGLSGNQSKSLRIRTRIWAHKFFLGSLTFMLVPLDECAKWFEFAAECTLAGVRVSACASQLLSVTTWRDVAQSWRLPPVRISLVLPSALPQSSSQPWNWNVANCYLHRLFLMLFLRFSATQSFKKKAALQTVHPISIHTASLFPHFLTLQSWTNMDTNIFFNSKYTQIQNDCVKKKV